jgi:hypothetical protein
MLAKSLLGMLVFLVTPITLPAQQEPNAHASCRGVLTSTVASGHEHHDLPHCGAEVASELGRMLRSLRTERDLEKLRLLHRVSFFVRDPAVFSQAVALANNVTADPHVRVLGLYVALTQIDRGTDFTSSGVRKPFREPLSEICEEAAFGAPDDTFWHDGGLPSDAVETLRSTAAGLGLTTQPLMVRRFARCVLLVLPEGPEPA